MTIINQILEVSSDSKGGVKLKGTGYVFEKQGDATGWHLDDFTGKINGGIFKGTKTDSKGRSSDFEFRRHNKDFVAIDLGASSIAVATSVQEEYIHHVDMDALLTDIRDVSEKHARSAFINSKIGLKKPKK